MPNSHSRTLLQNHMTRPHTSPPPSSGDRPRNNSSFDANVVMVLSVLFCALICSLGLNSIIRCALRCSTRRMSLDSNEPPTARPANTGIKKKSLQTFPTIIYAPGVEMTECAICISEFAAGERVRVLPTCRHGFHARCIDRWLDSHSSCPTCRHSLVEACSKMVGVGATSSEAGRIEPLQREGLIRSHDSVRGD